MGLKARLAIPIGERYSKSLWWDGCTEGEHYSHQRAESLIDDAACDWPPCGRCGAEGPKNTRPEGQATHRVWNTPSGDLEPGCLYWATWLHSTLESGGLYCHFWDNCFLPHLMAVCPNGHHWDIDSRAANCGSKGDRQHRCWIRHGDAPMITVDKAGKSCQAGAGSIQAGNWHGFLRNGEFVT